MSFLAGKPFVNEKQRKETKQAKLNKQKQSK